jgi:hypothetical protein
MDCPLLIFIVKTVLSRYDDLETRLGPVRVARLARHVVRGCWQVEAIMMGWVAGVVSEITSNPDTLIAVNILLSLFMAEARALRTDNQRVVREFCRNWTGRCIRRLMEGMGIGDLRMQGERAGPKWGSRLVSQSSSKFLLSLNK